MFCGWFSDLLVFDCWYVVRECLVSGYGVVGFISGLC